MPVERDSDCYNMSHKKRGMAIIFNNAIFDDPELNLDGTEDDRDNLKNTMQYLGFDVTVYNDLKRNELKVIVKKG
jgi:caspase-like apoptosis-related cysteine protease